LGRPRPQIGGAHDVGGVLRLVFGLLEIGRRIASAKKEQACVRQSAEADETTNAYIAGPRSSGQIAPPCDARKFIDPSAPKKAQTAKKVNTEVVTKWREDRHR
jgi:hypothetical protein